MTNQELSAKTKWALVEALKHAMEKKPLSKITVTELVTECKINRKTFYYYFENIYDLLKWMLEQEAIEIVKQFDFIINPEEAFRFVMEYIAKNKHILNCAYDSLGQEELKRFLYNDLKNVMSCAILQIEDELKISVDDSFKDLLASFYTEAAAGIIVDWMKNKFSQDMEEILDDMLLTFRASIPAILKTKAGLCKLPEHMENK